MQMSLSKKAVLFVFLMSISVFIIAKFLQSSLLFPKTVMVDEIYTTTEICPNIQFQILPNSQIEIKSQPIFRFNNTDGRILSNNLEYIDCPGRGQFNTLSSGTLTYIPR